MTIDKIVSELEGKATLLIFLRDNYPDVLEKWKARNRATTNDGTNSEMTNNGDVKLR